MIKALHDQLTNFCQRLLDEQVISPIEPITVLRGDGSRQENVLAQVSLAATISEIDEKFAAELGIYTKEKVVDRQFVTLRNGQQVWADSIEVRFTVQGQDRTSLWLVTDRSEEKHWVLISKPDCRGFFVHIPEEE